MTGVIRNAAMWLACAGMVFTGFPASAQGFTYDSAMQWVDSKLAEVSSVRQSLDRTAFDLPALAMELSFEDPATITAWVEENIAYQAYGGMLRGPVGTLHTRAGNALDQSLLLAYLLSAGGYDTRIARTTLDDDHATQLLATISPGPQRDYSDLQARLEPVGWLDAGLIFNNLPTDNDMQETFELSGALIDTLAAAGLGLDEDQPDLHAEAADYAWVQYRLGSEDWTDAHVAAPFLADTTLEAYSYLEEDVPEELQHRLRFEVVIEVSDGYGLTIEPVMDPWEQPVASIAGQVITYTNKPDTDSLDTSVAELLELNSHFIPWFNGDAAPGAVGFDIHGELHDLSAGDQVGGLGGGVGGMFGGMFGGGGSDEPETDLSAQWIVVTLIAPGGEEREFRRTIVDRVGPEARAAGEASVNQLSADEAHVQLMTDFRMMAFSGTVPVDYMLDIYLGRLEEQRPMMERIMAITYGVEPASELEEVIMPASPLEHMLAMDVLDAGPANASSYRAEPALLAFSEQLHGVAEDSTVIASLDIMNNARRTVGTDAAVTALNHGVWETLAERDLMEDTVNNTANFGTDLTVITARDELPAGLSADARHNLQNDLEHGYVVLLPDGAEAWWRVDLATGETLGVTRDGRGQAFIEYVYSQGDNLGTIWFAVDAHMKCKAKGGGVAAEACCHLNAMYSNVIGARLGMGLGGAFGAGAGFAWTMGTGLAGADFSPLAPGC